MVETLLLYIVIGSQVDQMVVIIVFNLKDFLLVVEVEVQLVLQVVRDFCLVQVLVGLILDNIIIVGVVCVKIEVVVRVLVGII